jgi:hypothetical protein
VPYSEPILIPEMLKTPALITYDTFRAISQFRSTASHFIANNRTNLNKTEVVAQLIGEGKQLDVNLQALCSEGSETPSRWRRQVSSALPESNMCSPANYLSSVESAEVRNNIACARIRLHETLRDLVEHTLLMNDKTRQDAEATIMESRQNINAELDEICGSIPFCLHRIDASGNTSTDHSQRVLGGGALVFSLGLVLTCSLSSESQRSLAEETLREIGHSVGVRQALFIMGE